MLEKFLVYPYQRINQTHMPGKRRSRRRIRPYKNAKLNFHTMQAAVVNQLNSLFTLDRLLPAALIILMSRAFVLGELLPFVYACLVAFSYRDKTSSLLLAACAAIGLVTVLPGIALGSSLITLFILLGVINYTKIPAEKAWWGLPLLCIAVIFVSKTIFMCFTTISFYQGMVIIFEALIAGILTFVFLIVADSLRQKRALTTFSFEDMAAYTILGIGVIMGLSDVTLGGLSVAGIICRLGILVAAFFWGSPGGTMTGLMVGIIPSISSSIFPQALGIYAISGLLAGLFRNFGQLGVIIGFMLGTLGFSMFINATQATVLGMWETGAASLLFILLPGSLKEKLQVQSLGPISKFKEKEFNLVDLSIKDTARNRIEHLAGVFDELSSTFNQEVVPSRRQPAESGYLTYLYDEVFSGYCNKCSRYEECWVKNSYNTSQEILDIFSTAEGAQQVSYEECPVSFRRRCIYGREMLGTINHLFDNLRINEYWLDRLQQSRGLISHQLQGISQVIKNLAQEMDMKAVVDFELRTDILREAKKRGLLIKDLSPIHNGENQFYINVLMSSCADGCQCQTQVAPVISGILGEKVAVSNKRCPRITGTGDCEFTLSRIFNYRILSGAAQVAKEEVCGDSFTIATLKEGKELVALSDGMGVGEKACSESQAAVRLLENLLTTGFDQEIALKTINSVLLLRSDSERFATLDMLMIDLYTAELDFIKVGSAPSFIKRGKRVEVVNSNSVPIGILDNLDVVSDKRALFPGDIIIMISDGILEASRHRGEDLWLNEFLVDIAEKDPQLLAEMIINRALSLCQGKPRDDMTVVCLYVELS
ncbi:MAG: stage II sporulation protein E [Syntrophomonadaceae bacterium]|jgi:stage II sporulation protein E